VLAEIEADAAQMVWLAPAMAVVGGRSLQTPSDEEEAGHTPLVTIHSAIFSPELNPVIVDDGEEEAEMTPLPCVTVHAPVPVTGATALSVAVVPQTVCEGPADAEDGD
jgi:hypothetical protein